MAIVEEIFTSVVTEDRKEAVDTELKHIVGLGDALRERIVSRPPEGCKQVFNFYYDPVSEQYVIVREE